jgi:hypothetical protein
MANGSVDKRSMLVLHSSDNDNGTCFHNDKHFLLFQNQTHVIPVTVDTIYIILKRHQFYSG